MLANLNSRSKKMKKESESGLPEIFLHEFEMGGATDKEAVKLCIKKHQKLLSWLFKKYTSKKLVPGVKSTQFSKTGYTADKMSSIELCLLRNDFDLKKYFKKEEVTAIVRLYN